MTVLKSRKWEVILVMTSIISCLVSGDSLYSPELHPLQPTVAGTLTPAMPPRLKNGIVLVAPADAGMPPDFRLVHLPPRLSFTGATLALADAMPWLSWDPPVDPNENAPAQATAPLAEIEAIILPLCYFSAEALQRSPHSTCLSAAFLKHALAALFRAGLRGKNLQGYAEAALSIIDIRDSSAPTSAYTVLESDLWDFAPPDPKLHCLDWLKATSWADWQTADGSFLRCARTFAMLGSRILPQAPTPNDSRMLVMLQQVDLTFCKLFDSGTLPDSFRGPQIADWVVSVDWPDALSLLPVSDNEALSEWRRFKAFAAGSQAEQSTILVSVLRRAMFSLPLIGALFAGAPMSGTAAASPEILRQLMAQLKLEHKDPRWSDFQALDSALGEMGDIIDSVEDSPDAPIARLHI